MFTDNQTYNMSLNLGDAVDEATFNQILEMDDTDEREFSSSIVTGFFEQAEDTFKSMEEALYGFLGQADSAQKMHLLTSPELQKERRSRRTVLARTLSQGLIGYAGSCSCERWL